MNVVAFITFTYMAYYAQQLPLGDYKQIPKKRCLIRIMKSPVELGKRECTTRI